MRNIWLDGIMGVVVGDALGVPVEFTDREELKTGPVEDMEGYGTYNLPPGSWSDDSSMTLATLDSLRDGYDLKDIMEKFVAWYDKAEYTPHGVVFDVGFTCENAILTYKQNGDVNTCGLREAHDNGNGSLMRILPICLYMYEKQKREGLNDSEVIAVIHDVSALTHAHLRSKIACGLYYYIVQSILDGEDGLVNRVKDGIEKGFRNYKNDVASMAELAHYGRISDIEVFSKTPEEEIHSYGYVVPTLEAALWSLVRSNSYAEAVLTAVNLGKDTDTVAAIAGGLAGLYYGYEGIPEEWLEVIVRREWIEELSEVF